jgi:hypothetical protein
MGRVLSGDGTGYERAAEHERANGRRDDADS